MTTVIIPSTPEDISQFIKTATIDDIMRVSMKMREEVESLRKKDEKMLKKMEKEAERLEKKKQKEADKEARRLEKEAEKVAKMEKKKAIVKIPDSDSSSDSDSDSESKSKSKKPVKDSGGDDKRKVGRPRKEKKERKPRAPTEYNLFLKECMLNLSKSHPDMGTRERMKMAVEEWRKKKCVEKEVD
jgi:hypothetical protein